jgi:hypothetical protein
MSEVLTAAHFIERLETYRSPNERQKYERAFKPGEDDEFIGVRMGQVFELAKEFMAMPPAEIEKLLESPIHKARVGAVSIMDFQARSKQTDVPCRRPTGRATVQVRDQTYLGT